MYSIALYVSIPQTDGEVSVFVCTCLSPRLMEKPMYLTVALYVSFAQTDGEASVFDCCIVRVLIPSRLMEKPGTAATHRHSHQDTAWGDKAGGSGGGGQHTQYIRRLADLRDELINQEETALARALDRLRLHSINNRDAARSVM